MMKTLINLYKDHVTEWKNCTRCELSQQRERIVLAKGDIPCDVLFLGEAPGESEDVVGLPFVGPAGRLLEALISRAVRNSAVREMKFAFTNLVACFPKEMKDIGVNEPPDYTIKECMPRVSEFIALADPSRIVCVGKLASKWIERIMSHSDILRIHIPHPAAILRANIANQGLLS